MSQPFATRDINWDGCQNVRDLGGLITHTRAAADAADAYPVAFTDPACLKMVLDWNTL